MFNEQNIRALTSFVISVSFIRVVMYFRLEGICSLNENDSQRPIKSTTVRRCGLEVGVVLKKLCCWGWG